MFLFDNEHTTPLPAHQRDGLLEILRLRWLVFLWLVGTTRGDSYNCNGAALDGMARSPVDGQLPRMDPTSQPRALSAMWRSAQ